MNSKNQKFKVVMGEVIPEEEKLTIPPKNAKKTKTFEEIYNEALMEIKTAPFNIEKRRERLVRVALNGEELSVVSKDKEKKLLNKERNEERGKEIESLLEEIEGNTDR